MMKDYRYYQSQIFLLLVLCFSVNVEGWSSHWHRRVYRSLKTRSLLSRRRKTARQGNDATDDKDANNDAVLVDKVEEASVTPEVYGRVSPALSSGTFSSK